MIPASWAVASASPFGSSRSRCAVSGAIRTLPRATARRRDIGFPPTSTMRTDPDSSTCESSLILGAIVPKHVARIVYWRRSRSASWAARSRPRGRAADVLADRLQPAPSLLGGKPNAA